MKISFVLKSFLSLVVILFSMDKSVCVIGLGEIGSNVFTEIGKTLGKENVFGVDINQETLKIFEEKGYKVGKTTPKSDVYIICVYLTEQVLEVIKRIDYSNNPLVSIDATILPGASKKILDWREKEKKEFDFILFPHRFNPNDPEHYVFNLDRVIGGENEVALSRGLEFFSQFMDKKLIHTFPLEIAELTKPVENAYRFMEIAIAEQLKMCCDEKGINFEQLRKAASTKWNINIYEARDGISGKCLPKDVKLIDEFFPTNELFKKAIEFNEKYKEFIEEKKGKETEKA
jgi:UDP-N-acetyl-D-mannosaminuronate dehydrogenase